MSLTHIIIDVIVKLYQWWSHRKWYRSYDRCIKGITERWTYRGFLPVVIERKILYPHLCLILLMFDGMQQGNFMPYCGVLLI